MSIIILIIIKNLKYKNATDANATTYGWPIRKSHSTATNDGCTNGWSSNATNDAITNGSTYDVTTNGGANVIANDVIANGSTNDAATNAVKHPHHH